MMHDSERARDEQLAWTAGARTIMVCYTTGAAQGIHMFAWLNLLVEANDVASLVPILAERGTTCENG